MAVWLLTSALAAGLLSFAIWGEIRVRRFSRGHVTGHATLFGRGLYVSRTPDGTWWRVRLRRRACAPLGGSSGEDPPATGVREPRWPLPSSPSGAAASRRD